MGRGRGPSEEDAPEDTLAWIMESVEPDPVERFSEQSEDGAELRYASWDPEEGGRDWALATWRSLRFEPQ